MGFGEVRRGWRSIRRSMRFVFEKSYGGISGGGAISGGGGKVFDDLGDRITVGLLVDFTGKREDGE